MLSPVRLPGSPLGRAYKSSNPYTGSVQFWNETDFDALGRPVSSKLVQPDGTVTSGNTSTFAYATNTVTVTDPAGNARKTQVDSLGRMTSVFEPDVAHGNTLTQQTSYAYNVLNLLTGVTQGVQSRAYAYDDLARVSKITTPEAGTVCFGTYSGGTCQTNGYDSFGNLVSRTDARGVVTAYGYDNLNRLTTISYNVGSTGVPATPGVTLTYDQGGAAAYALGRLTSMTDGVGSETYTYNSLGETTALQKIISGTTYPLTYTYNFAGGLNSITYPSGRNVQQNLDNIGRLSSIADTLNSVNTTRASGFAYNPAFEVTGFNYGNGVVAAFGYTQDRLLLQSLAYTKGSTTLFSANYWYKTDSTNCPSAPAGNNGQIRCITDNVDSGRNATYTYDALYRLTAAATTGSTNYSRWGLSWGYDQYGNRLNQTQTAGSPPQNSLSFANPGGAQTNRPDNMCFDANGNLMTETSVSPCPPSNPTYTYDAENRLVNYMGSGATYTFDGNGLRVKKAASGTTTVYIFSGSKVIAEYDNGAAATAPSREYIYSGGALLAKIESGASIYYHADHLSNRVLTDSSGNSLGQRGHYPFGETWYESGTATKLTFTTYERDSESTNDYAVARTYINRFGRFPSSDPLAGSTGDPQSLNRYTYGRNIPVSVVDPSGLRADGCLILKNQDTDKPSQLAGGYSDGESLGDPAEPQAPVPPCGHSTPGGFPLVGGNIFDLLWAWLNDDIEIGTPSWTGEGWHIRDDLSDLDLLIGFLPPGLLADPGPLADTTKQPPPPPGFQKCLDALGEKGTFSRALLRASRNWNSITQAASDNGIDAKILASVGIVETGFQETNQLGGGQGRGYFQLDLGAHPDAARTIGDIDREADYAAGILASNIDYYSSRGFSSGWSEAAGIRDYNASPGRGHAKTLALMRTGYAGYLNANSTGRNYTSLVLGIAVNCFN